MKRFILFITIIAILALPSLVSAQVFSFFDLGSAISGFSVIDGVPTFTGDLSILGRISALKTTEQFRLSYDAANYATWTVAADGALTLVTVDASAAEGDINFNPDGFVGIKTVVPTTELDVTGAITASTNLNWGGQYQLGEISANQAYFRNVSAGNVANLRIQSADRDGTDNVTLNYDAIGQPPSGSRESLIFGYFAAQTSYQMYSFESGAGVNRPLQFGHNANPNDLVVNVDGSISTETYVIRKHVALSGATDNNATNIFTITTTDETGSADGGMYSVKVHLTAGEATAASGAVNTASVSLIAHWTRIMASAGTGANSAIVEISESASADEGTGAIATVTLTVTETSEFVQQVLLLVDTSGGTFDGFALVELIYSDFTTAPVIG